MVGISYYQRNKERSKKWAKDYYWKHREKVIQRADKYYWAHRKRMIQAAREYWKKNPQKRRASDIKYQQRHKEAIRQKWRNLTSKQRENIRIGQRRTRKERYKRNVKYRIDDNIRNAIWRSLKGKKKNRKWESLVGYALNDLMRYLENQFDDKMNWQNYGNYWHIDHIRPQSLFRYGCPEDSEFKKCWALENLQPLEKTANLIKGNRII